MKDEEVPLKQEKAFNGKWREDEKLEGRKTLLITVDIKGKFRYSFDILIFFIIKGRSAIIMMRMPKTVGN